MIYTGVYKDIAGKWQSICRSTPHDKKLAWKRISSLLAEGEELVLLIAGSACVWDKEDIDAIVTTLNVNH